MGILTWIVVAVVILAIIGLGAGAFFSGVWRGAEEIRDNPTVQNATGPLRDIVNETVNSGIDDMSKNEGNVGMVELTTGKPTYEQGEPVIFTVKNNADEALDFPNSVFGLEVTNADNGEEIPIFSAQVITSIEPGKSKSMTLTLEGGDGQPAKAGNYIAKVYTTPRGDTPAAQANFVITE